ncbi:MAG: hypothetical protein JSU03_02500 [Bacteroidetes bacterium]|nr:hypothetical protein [Bacteroidota bacterium]MBS1756128.1 hypothetical protein [Bacteroidota bacterium]
MSLDNIQLSTELITGLYKKSLIELNDEAIKEMPAAKFHWPILGNNLKRILIIVNEEQAAFLPEGDLNFLIGVLAACKLTMADVALLNYFQNKGVKIKELNENLSPDKIIMFGTDTATLDIPLQFPNYQIQKYNNQVYVSAPSLSILSKDVMAKKELWKTLKTLFEI